MPSQRDMLLQVLGEAEEHKIEGRTRLQKLVFLAQNLLSEDDNNVFDFVPHNYGPFSEDILHELDEMKAQGLVEEEVTNLRKGKKYTYSLTPRGEERYEQLDMDQSDDSEDLASAVHQTVSQFNSMPISRLLEYVYNKFPRYTVKSKL